MEGLVKGLLNVALGNDENDDRNNQSRDRDERSRSTWAQVSTRHCHFKKLPFFNLC